MRAILWFSGVVCLVLAGIFLLNWLQGKSHDSSVAAWFLVVGITFMALATILDRLALIELAITASRGAGTDRVKTAIGEFEMLGQVEGEAMCLGCRKTVPKAGLYYNKAADVYYHPQCLARDRSR
jgi:hypothetical protein